MATKTQSTQLEVRPREKAHSRETRRLRRAGRVPGVLYGRGREPFSFDVDARELRHALAATGAVLELVDRRHDGVRRGQGGPEAPGPRRGHARRPLPRRPQQADQAAGRRFTLIGGEDAPGAKEGGVLEHVTREVNVEALPNVIPESIELDVSAMEINDTITLSALTAPEGVTFVVPRGRRGRPSSRRSPRRVCASRTTTSSRPRPRSSARVAARPLPRASPRATAPARDDSGSE